jgi:putative flippase GtrA
MGRRFAAMGAAMCARVGVIAALETICAPDTALAVVYVAIGAGASLAANYMLSRFWVFKR